MMLSEILCSERTLHTITKDIVLPELIHQLAYGNELWAQSTITDPSDLQKITINNLYNYHCYTLHPHDIGQVWKHEDALKLGAELFGDIPSQLIFYQKSSNLKQTSLFVYLKSTCQ